MIIDRISYRLGLIACAVILIAIVGCGASEPTVPTPIPNPVDVSLGSILHLAEQNKEAAKQEYEGQFVKMEGLISSIDSDKFEITPIGSDILQMSHATCEFDKTEQASDLLKLREEQRITVHGRIKEVDSFIGIESVELEPCFFGSKLVSNTASASRSSNSGSTSNETSMVNSKPDGGSGCWSEKEAESLLLGPSDFPNNWQATQSGLTVNAKHIEFMTAKLINITVDIFPNPEDASSKFSEYRSHAEVTVANRGYSGDSVREISSRDPLYIWMHKGNPSYGTEAWQAVGLLSNVVFKLNHSGSINNTKEALAESIAVKQLEKLKDSKHLQGMCVKHTQAVEQNVDQGNWSTVTDPDGIYAISVPANWEIITDVETLSAQVPELAISGLIPIFVGVDSSTGSNVSISLDVSRLIENPEPIDLQEYIEFQEADIGNNMNVIGEIERTSTTLDGIPGTQFRYRSRQNGVDIQYAQVLLVSDELRLGCHSIGFLVTGTSNVGLVEQNETIGRILGSLTNLDFGIASCDELYTLRSNFMDILGIPPDNQLVLATPIPSPPATATPIPPPPATATPVPAKNYRDWRDFQMSGAAWQEISRSISCREGPCLESGETPNGRFSTMWLYVYHETDPRFVSWMAGDTIGFQVKTSTQQNSDFLTLKIAGQLVAEWSGETNWTEVSFNIPPVRPTMIEWKYLKDSSGIAGADTVWIKEVEVD
jgi:hypothetical protein